MAQQALDWIPLVSSDITTNSSSKTFTVPANHYWRIKSIFCAFTTNATVGNRQVQIDILNPSSTVIFNQDAGTTQAASLTRQYAFAPHLQDLTAFRNTTFLATPFPELVLPYGHIIKVYDSAAIAPTGSGENLLVYITYERYALYY